MIFHRSERRFGAGLFLDGGFPDSLLVCCWQRNTIRISGGVTFLIGTGIYEWAPMVVMSRTAIVDDEADDLSVWVVEWRAVVCWPQTIPHPIRDEAAKRMGHPGQATAQVLRFALDDRQRRSFAGRKRYPTLIAMKPRRGWGTRAGNGKNRVGRRCFALRLRWR